MSDASAVLRKINEISLTISLESNLCKILILSAASYFEYTLSRVVAAFAGEVTGGNALISSLVRIKAIDRQFHTWFEWDRSNANRFFALFGREFRDYMAERIEEDNSLAEGVRAFMEIGRERNRLIHSDYASHVVDKTPDEIYSLYRKANVFVSMIGDELRACSEKLL